MNHVFTILLFKENSLGEYLFFVPCTTPESRKYIKTKLFKNPIIVLYIDYDAKAALSSLLGIFDIACLKFYIESLTVIFDIVWPGPRNHIVPLSPHCPSSLVLIWLLPAVF